jgi:Ca-activated chloride channel homolog
VRPPLLLILLVGTTLVAQSAKPATLVASIVDKHGNAVSLPAEAKIYISEDGKQTQAGSAQKLTGPVLYVVMLDSSSSADDTPMRQVVKELPNFFQRALRPQDKVTVIGFSEQATTEIEPTNDVETIRRALSSLRWSGRTALFDSVIQVCTRTIPKMTLPDGRVAVILLTDGEDSASRAREDAALKAAEASHAVFYPIDIRFGLKMWAGEFVQQDFANETGGKFFQFASTKDLQNALQEIQNLIDSEYRIEFVAKPDSGSKTGLKVKVEGQSDLRVIAPKHLSE